MAYLLRNAEKGNWFVVDPGRKGPGGIENIPGLIRPGSGKDPGALGPPGPIKPKSIGLKGEGSGNEPPGRIKGGIGPGPGGVPKGGCMNTGGLPGEIG